MKKNKKSRKTAAVIAVIMSMAVIAGPAMSTVHAQEIETNQVAQDTQSRTITSKAQGKDEDTTLETPNSAVPSLATDNDVAIVSDNNDTNDVANVAANNHTSEDDDSNIPSSSSLTANNALNAGSNDVPSTLEADDIPIDVDHFPDEYFRAWIKQQTYGADDKLTPDEIANITEIKVIEKNISNLKGIEYFTSLKTLNINHNPITELDLSHNLNLEVLYCSYCDNMTKLNVSNTALQTVFGSFNSSIQEMDLSNLPNLTKVSIGSCDSLTKLDVSNDTKLETLSCAINQLTTLNIANTPNLKTLTCNSNQLTSLDVSANPLLEQLECVDNPISTLDLSSNSKLTSLDCSNSDATIVNHMTTLNLENNPELLKLRCNNVPLKEVDLSKNTKLKSLYCPKNNLICLNVADSAPITSITVHSQNPCNIYTNNGTFDLATIAPHINSSQISNVTGATINGTTLSNLQYDHDVTYTYKIKNSNTLSVTLKVKKANDWTADISIGNWQYKEEPKTPTAAAVQGDPRFVYSNAADGIYTDQVPETAGIWYVKAIVDEAENTAPLESDPLQFEITKAPAPDIIVPTGLKGTVGTTLVDVEAAEQPTMLLNAKIGLPDGWTWASPDQVIEAGSHQYAARLAVDDDNYNYTNPLVQGYNQEGHYVERMITVEGTPDPSGGSTGGGTQPGGSTGGGTQPDDSGTSGGTQPGGGSTGGGTQPGDSGTGGGTQPGGGSGGGTQPGGGSGGGTQPDGGSSNATGDTNGTVISNTNNLDDANKSQNNNNVKTGDVTASLAGGLSVAAILSACTAWFAFKRKGKAD